MTDDGQQQPPPQKRTPDKPRAPNRWAWVPEAMPGVARQMLEARRRWGDAHVDQCWTMGVVRREPGWFFAREGAVALGTPWNEPALANFAAATVTATQALLVMREPEGKGT